VIPNKENETQHLAVSTPIKYLLKRELVDILLEWKQLNVVFHSPYWVSLLSSKNHDYNMEYLFLLRRQCVEYGIPFNYVTHMGYPDDKEMDYGPCQDRVEYFIYRALESWPKECQGTLWLETDSGYRRFWNGYNGLRSLIEIVSRIDDKRVRVCADSEHIYASGEYAPRGDDWNWISLVHLNSIPEEVIFGRHLDRHSFTPLEECKIGEKFVFHYFFESIKRQIPMILERRDLSIVDKDLAYLKQLGVS
jgi:endonuclease IV